MPACVMPDHASTHPANGLYSCCFCGVGDGGKVVTNKTKQASDMGQALPQGTGTLWVGGEGDAGNLLPAKVGEDGLLRVRTSEPLTSAGGVLHADLEIDERRSTVMVREVDREVDPEGRLTAQSFQPYRRSLSVTDSHVVGTVPTKGCVKLRHSTVRQRPAFPIHVAPSVLGEGGRRREISYEQGIAKLADLVLDHRAPYGKTLLYCCGQIDYFTIFALQEVFRLLGVRNLAGNAEHCLNAGASHNEVLTGQEGPFLTMDQAIEGPGEHLYIFNGWNGYVTHPPAFLSVLKRKQLDAYLVEVMVTESAKALAKKLGPDRILLIKPGTDPHLALAIAHELLTRHAERIEQRFIERFADKESFARYKELALNAQFAPATVAERIAAEPKYEDNLLKSIRRIAARMAEDGVIPINIPSVGLSQTSGVVAHCLWGNAMAMVGKYGLRPDGTPAGGTLRIPGQINAESEIQGLSGKYFMGRIPIANRAEAAIRMGLPPHAYDAVAEDEHRAALDYSDGNGDQRELFICLGTQFEANMMNRPRWLEKLKDPRNRLVVIDPIPDPFTLEHADLVLPSPPHPATTKLYQNGEWRLTLTVPQKHAPPQTRSDATIIYDLMAEIIERLERDPQLRMTHPDLAEHLDSGYLRQRFCAPSEGNRDGLLRPQGEVSRPQLWTRVLDYMQAGSGPLYCLPRHADGRLVEWSELLDDSVIYGGVGTTRFMLDYDDPNAVPYRNIYCEPGSFRFFVPSEEDLESPDGLILNSGRSTLSDDRELVRFATSTFNSGKATPLVGMPEINPLFVSPKVAARLGLETGDDARITNRATGSSIVLPVVVSHRVKGETLFTNFHKTIAKLERGLCVNTVTNHVERCRYSNQTRLKATRVSVERVVPESETDGRAHGGRTQVDLSPWIPTR
ncbi:MAG: molybdopterin-dependent oxidoreductase [Myxococcales bacterium]|nr:molybdopterin-dependent oxidoreductase [Myxococcales bacterium]